MQDVAPDNTAVQRLLQLECVEARSLEIEAFFYLILIFVLLVVAVIVAKYSEQ